jgi:hypothetical protein
MTMTMNEIGTLWQFWREGSDWHGRRVTGQTVSAGSFLSALRKAEWHELLSN